MDPTEQQLLDAVLAAPDDDAPRLVYADWLQERGDPHGELIAMQCRPELYEHDVVDRIWRLEQAHRTAWLEQLPLSSLAPMHFVRGFVERFELTAESWIRHGEALCARTPVRELLVRRVDRLADVLATPATARVRTLELRDESLRHERLAGLDRVPSLPRLETLVLWRCSLNDRCLRALASWAGAAPRRLVLDKNPFHGRGLGDLLGSPFAARLEDIGLDFVRVGDPAAESLAALSSLRRLSLAGTEIGGLGLQILARGLRSVEVLIAAGSKTLDPAGIQALGAWPHLRRLDLGDSNFGDNGVDALCSIAALLPELRELDVHACGITSRGAAALIASCLRLSILKLHGNDLGVADQAALVERFGRAVVV